MKNEHKYKYEDPDNIYTNSKTSVLINKLDIEDDSLLTVTESIWSGRRLEELAINPIKIESAETILKIHGYIFQDLYEWAGKVRTVQISKEGTQFLPTERFSEGFTYINELIEEYWALDDFIPSVAKKLAEILDAINHLHPFREGNGRAQREFIRVLALEKGYQLDLSSAEDEAVFERYMSGTIEGNKKLLSELIESIIVKV